MDEMKTSGHYEVRDFGREVLERSTDIPVLVDFWAPWCGPCRFLGPIVEKLAGEAQGRWALVKVDTERNPALAAEQGIRGIPYLKLFHNGRVIAELSGALPEVQLREWIEHHLPSAGRKRMAEAEGLLQHGDEAGAVAILDEVLAMEPALDEARTLLARLLVMRDPARVAPLLAHHLHLDTATELTDLADALLLPHDALPEAQVKELVWQGLEGLRRNDPDAALGPWVEAVVRDKAYAEELPRRLCVALLKLLGWEHPVAERWRKRFHMALA